MASCRGLGASYFFQPGLRILGGGHRLCRGAQNRPFEDVGCADGRPLATGVEYPGPVSRQRPLPGRSPLATAKGMAVFRSWLATGWANPLVVSRRLVLLGNDLAQHPLVGIFQCEPVG